MQRLMIDKLMVNDKKHKS